MATEEVSAYAVPLVTLMKHTKEKRRELDQLEDVIVERQRVAQQEKYKALDADALNQAIASARADKEAKKKAFDEAHKALTSAKDTLRDLTDELAERVYEAARAAKAPKS